MQKFFSLLAEGHFNPDQIDVEMVSGTMKRTPESEAYIEQAWQQHLAAGAKPWPNDLKVTRYRFAGIEQAGDRLKIKLDPCVSYRDHIGSLTREFEERFGHDAVPNALALTTVIVTTDKQILVTLRNQKTDYKPGGYHVSLGGFMDTRKNETVVQAALRETQEETGITPDEIQDLVCLGAAYNPWTLHTDLIFKCVTVLTAAEVLERTHDDENDLLFIATDKKSFETWMLWPMHANVVITMAAMLLVGQELFGPAWREEVLKILAVNSKNYDSKEVRENLEARDVERLRVMVAEARSS